MNGLAARPVFGITLKTVYLGGIQELAHMARYSADSHHQIGDTKYNLQAAIIEKDKMTRLCSVNINKTMPRKLWLMKYGKNLFSTALPVFFKNKNKNSNKSKFTRWV